jgi:hypothetical protein
MLPDDRDFGPAMARLTQRQCIFVDGLFSGLKQTAAARRAGYSNRGHADSVAAQTVRKPRLLHCSLGVLWGTRCRRKGDSNPRQCAGTVKKLSLELGGNAPFIVFDDADIEATVKGAIASKYRNAGQTCVCANRILVQDGVYDAFTKRLAETAGAMKVADGFEPGAVIGPLIDMKAVEKVEAYYGPLEVSDGAGCRVYAVVMRERPTVFGDVGELVEEGVVAVKSGPYHRLGVIGIVAEEYSGMRLSNE